jgi:hypothetical protein
LQKDKEKYIRFFKPLVEDLKKLEAGVQIGGKTVKMGVICYSADNLEASIVGGFSQCYSSNDVCRICHQQHKDLQQISGCPKVARWTREEYDAAVENLEPGVRGEFGLNSGCIFNDSISCSPFTVSVRYPPMSCTTSARKLRLMMPCPF